MELGVWVVGLSNTVHIVATVVWIGWSCLLALVVGPQADRALSDAEVGGMAAQVLRRAPVAYLGLAVLGGTGMYQMAANPSYIDFLTFTNLWSLWLFVKHIGVLAAMGLMGYLALSLLPDLRLETLARTKGREQPGRVAQLAARVRAVAWLNLAANGLVILATGVMTALPGG